MITKIVFEFMHGHAMSFLYAADTTSLAVTLWFSTSSSVRPTPSRQESNWIDSTSS